MKVSTNGELQHKVGYVHYNGLIIADALKHDMSGNTVSMYRKTDQAYPYEEIYLYTVVEWDKDGQTEISIDKFGHYENAVTKYLELAFNVSM